MEIYQTFCERYFLSVFPDTGQLLPLSPSIDLAVQGILLGREYSTLSAILRPAFYDLARAPLFDYEPKPTRKHSATNTSQGLDPLESGTILRQAITNDAVQGETLHPLARLPSRDLIALLDLQKRLSLTWDGIFDALNYICRTDRCRSTHCAKVQAIKMECPYDPILGVQHILDRTAFTKSYCEEAAKGGQTPVESRTGWNLGRYQRLAWSLRWRQYIGDLGFQNRTVMFIRIFNNSRLILDCSDFSEDPLCACCYLYVLCISTWNQSESRLLITM